MYQQHIKRFSATIIIILFFTVCNINAQVDTLWTKTFGGDGDENGRSALQTADNGFIITGYTESFAAGLRDIWLIKTDETGDSLWTRSFGGGSDDEGYSVQQTSDGGFIILGSTSSFGAGLYDVWLIKTDASGDTLWTKTFGGSNEDYGMAVRQTADEGYIITGYTDISGDATYEIWLIKTDTSGDTVWTRTYGAHGNEFGYSVQQTEDGGYIVAGSTTSFGAGEDDIWLIRTDDKGDTVWTKTFGGENEDCGFSVQQTMDKGYIIAGFTISFGAGLYDVRLIKTDAAGDTLWTKTYGANGDEQGYSVQQTSDEGYIITGFKRTLGINNTNIWLIKTDGSGNVLWTKTFGGSKNERGYSVQQTIDGGYIITGFTTPFGAVSEDIWLIKTTPDVSSFEKNKSDFYLEYTLTQNYPNPFNPSTTIEFYIPTSGIVSLKVYNVTGQEVANLVNKELSYGTHKIEWKPENLSSGLYFYKLETKGYQETKKLVLMK